MLGKDPIKRGLNPYPYCDNDPVDYTDPTGEIPSIVVSALIGGAIGAVSGFVDSAISQVTGGQKFNLNGALGAAANGAVVGVARGALAGTGVGIPLAFATDFAAGTLGSALEQCISEGKVSARKSVTRGLTNAASNMFYGTGTMKSIKEAFGRGFGAGAATSGINYISDAIGSRQGQPSRSKAGMARVTDGLNAPVYGMFRNPRNNCGSENPFDTGLGYSSAKGYRYKTPQTGNGNGAGKGFSLAGFVRETLIGGVTGGLGSAAFYGADRVVKSLKDSILIVSNKDDLGASLSLNLGEPDDKTIIVAMENAGPSTPEEFKVFGHGNPYGIQYKDQILDADQVAHLIRNSPQYVGGEQKVKLYSCETGKLPNGFAQQLANNLGILVEAPNRELHPTKTGGFEIVKKVTNKIFLRGSWVPFNPKKS